MKKHYRIILIALILIIQISLLWGALPDIKILRTRNIGPGIVQKTLKAPSVPWMIYVMEIDLDNPYISVEAVDGGGLVKPSVMTKAQDSALHRLVGCTNGDFYQSDASSTNAGIVNGEIVKLEELSSSYPIYWPSLAIDENNKVTIGCHKYEGKITHNSTQLAINDINAGRGSNELIFYNQHMGNRTETSSDGIELKIRPLEAWSVNEVVNCIVENKESGIGNMQIQTGTAVLSGNGTAASTLNSLLNIGDTVEVLLKMKTFEDLSSSGVSYNYLTLMTGMKHLIGGFPTFVRNGQNYALTGYTNEGGGSTFATALHPRTAVGFDQDTTKMFLVVVDGRQTISAGINLVDLADIMIKLGAWRAMNFDGGGSSVMFVNNEIINSPSDGSERSVRNSVAIYSTAPEGNSTLAQIERDSIDLFMNQSYSMQVSQWDEFYHPKTSPDWSLTNIYCDESIGTIEGSEGEYLFTASLTGTDGYVYVSIGDSLLTDSMYVSKINLDSIMISPESAITDNNRTIDFIVRGIDPDLNSIKLDNTILSFSSLDSTVGYVDSLGSFHGLSEGETYVYVYYGEIYDSSHIEVIIQDGEVSLNRMEELEGWTLSGDNLDMTASGLYLVDRPDGVNGKKVFRIDYKTTATGKIYLSKDIEIEGLPELLLFDVLSDGDSYRVYTKLLDAGDKNISTSITVSNTDAYETKFINISNLTTSYPLMFKSFYMPLKTGIQEGSIYIDDLRVTYPGNTSICHDNSDEGLPESFKLYPCYPNPFNPYTVFHYDLSEDAQVSVEVFDIRGDKIDMPVNSYQHLGTYQLKWSPRGIGSGCYIYRIIANEKVAYGKLLFLK